MEIWKKCGLVRKIKPLLPPHCVLSGEESLNCGECQSVSREFLYRHINLFAKPGSEIKYSDPNVDPKIRWAEYITISNIATRAEIFNGEMTVRELSS